MITRILSLAFLIILSIFITPLVSLPFAIWYSYRWLGIELIVVGVFFDIYFGPTSVAPTYTIAAFSIIILVQTAKNFLMLK